MILFTIFAQIEKWGYIIGSFMVFMPILWDFIGKVLGRDVRISIGFWGVMLQLAGIALILITRYARRWGR